VNIQDSVVSPSLLATMNPTKDTVASGAAATQDRFMKLLVTQMKNQDPLNPLDNAQVTSQLAQLSTVTGIDKMNTTLEALISSFQSNQSLQAANMIGHGVLVPGANVDLVDGKGVFGVELSEPADNVQVTIRDASGTAVHVINVGSMEAGMRPMQWDGVADKGGVAADGHYTFEVAATRGGQKVDATKLAFGQVASVTTGAQGVKLNVVPNIGTVTMTDVRQIL
jgi:flagellar basal-body rod modification protein FlgD